MFRSNRTYTAIDYSCRRTRLCVPRLDYKNTRTKKGKKESLSFISHTNLHSYSAPSVRRADSPDFTPDFTSLDRTGMLNGMLNGTMYMESLMFLLIALVSGD